MAGLLLHHPQATTQMPRTLLQAVPQGMGRQGAIAAVAAAEAADTVTAHRILIGEAVEGGGLVMVSKHRSLTERICSLQISQQRSQRRRH